MSDLIKIVAALAIIAFMLAIGPWLVIWALNTLFPVLAIEFGLATWASVIVLGTFLRANVSVKRKD